MFISLQKEAFYNKREISAEMAESVEDLKNLLEGNEKDEKDFELLQIMLGSQGALKKENPVEVLDKQNKKLEELTKKCN
jgi:hypothetical protein